MVIRKIRPLGFWITIAVILFIVGIGVPLGVNIWYTNVTEQHACQALDLLIKDPHISPGQFRNAIVYWRQADGCKLWYNREYRKEVTAICHTRLNITAINGKSRTKTPET